jgi:hypothetical protein
MTPAVRLSRQVRRSLKACWNALQTPGRGFRGLRATAAGAAIAADTTLTIQQRVLLLSLDEDFTAENGRIAGRRRSAGPAATSRGRHRRPRMTATAHARDE